MHPNAHIYCRVSPSDNAEHGVSIRTQEDLCRAFADRQGWPVATVRRDQGVSGGLPLGERPGLQACIEGLAKGDVLLVLRRDRLFRTDPYDAAVIERAIAAKGARVVSTQGEGTASDSPSEIFLRRILDAKGENERLLIRQRTREALANKRAAGERTGQVPYGWRLADDGVHLERADEDDAPAELARRLRAEGLSLRKVAAALTAAGHRPKMGGEKWADSSVRRILGEMKCRSKA